MDNKAQEMTGRHQATSPFPKPLLTQIFATVFVWIDCKKLYVYGTHSYVQGCISVYSEETIDICGCLYIYIVIQLSLQAPYQIKALHGCDGNRGFLNRYYVDRAGTHRISGDTIWRGANIRTT